MKTWTDNLKINPIKNLLITKNKALLYFIKKDLLEEVVESVERLYKLPTVLKIIKQQQNNGAWKYQTGKRDIRTQENYNQLESYRKLAILLEKYGFNNQHQVIQKVTDFLFSFQSEEGDFRGIYGIQFSPNYTAAIMELLIKAGYDKDSHIEKGFRWLISIRQNDGGWAIPIRTHNAKWSDAMDSEIILQPKKEKSFSHLITGIVLRAFAAHPKYRKSEEAKLAGELLASRFFKPDKYPDRKTIDYWFRVSFPFWWTDIVSSLDTLSKIAFTSSHPQVKIALEILRERQLDNGLWDLKILKAKDKDLPLWIALAICRNFKRFY